MTPVKIEGFNVVYGAGQEEYQPLHAIKNAEGTMITEWELTPEERKAVAEGKNIMLSMMTFNKPLQPVVLYVKE